MSSYPGGKAGGGAFQKIINLMPPHRVYIEPFLGGGAVLREKLPAAVNIGIDRDEQALRAVASADIFRSDDGGHHRQKRRAAPEPTMRDLRSPAASSLPTSTAARRRASDPAMRDRQSSVLTLPDPIVKSDAAVPRFEFIVGNGIAFLERYDFKGDEIVYCDPPYLMETRSRKRDLYRCEMRALEHRQLLRVILKLPCRVLISGYSSQLYEQWLKKWNVITYDRMTRGGWMAKEFVWYNFTAPVELHDYRFLGDSFRERQRIGRKKQRWTARLAKMPTLERQALLAAIASTVKSDDASSLRNCD